MYKSDKGKYYPLMYLQIPTYKGYPGKNYSSTDYLTEYSKYRLNEIIKMQSSYEKDKSDNVLIILDGR